MFFAIFASISQFRTRKRFCAKRLKTLETVSRYKTFIQQRQSIGCEINQTEPAKSAIQTSMIFALRENFLQRLALDGANAKRKYKCGKL